MVEPDTIGLKNAPAQQEMGDVWNFNDTEAPLGKLNCIIGELDQIYIHQKMNLLEAVSQGMCEAQNQYKILNKDMEHIMSARESSSGCTRCCCAPHHSTMIFIENTEGQTLLSLERVGWQCPCPQKCLGCPCIFTDFCKDGLTVYEGKVEGDPGALENAPPPLTMLKQPTCGGGIFPKLDIYPKGNPDAEVSHQIAGPCIFGGCSELCCKSTYKYATTSGQDLGEVVHLTPKTLADVAKEICTDTDKFSVTFESKASMVDKVNLLSSAFLIDYLFFEMDNGMIACKNFNQLDITCCLCYCCGCICPCKLTLKKGEGGAGSGPSGDTE